MQGSTRFNERGHSLHLCTSDFCIFIVKMSHRLRNILLEWTLYEKIKHILPETVGAECVECDVDNNEEDGENGDL